jgi:hypothetical protein
VNVAFVDRCDRRMYCDPSIAVAGKRSVRSDNMTLSRRSDGDMMQVCRIVVGSSRSSYCSSDSATTGAGGPSWPRHRALKMMELVGWAKRRNAFVFC